MTSEETMKLLNMIAEVYPEFRKRDMKTMCTVWHRLVGGMSYKLMTDALCCYMAADTKGFAPTPGMLIAQLEQRATDEYMSESEAWSLIYRAICRSGYYAGEEYSKLPPILQEVVGSAHQLHEWGELTVSEVNTVLAGQLRRAYREAVQREVRGRFRPQLRTALPEPGAPRLES